MTNSSIIQIKNKILDNSLEVYACHPRTFEKLKSTADKMPDNWIVYPNPFCPEGEMQQADNQNPALVKFLFEVALPKSEFIKGENKNLRM